jgi:ABC-2 type transport system ATP-binding protein
MIEVVNLNKRFGRTVALDKVSFRIERGEKVALLGPNGAGKTTLLRILACFMAPSSGVVRIESLDTARRSLAVRERIGYLPEQSPLYSEMRVGEYLRFRGRLKGVTWRDRQKRIRELAERCGLRGLEGALLGRLSKGEARRVLLADCLLGAPDVLLLDEPTLGVDSVQGDGIRELLMGLSKDQTMLMSTHILDEAKRLCGRVIVLNQGQFVVIGTAAELLGSRTSLSEVFQAALAGRAPA